MLFVYEHSVGFSSVTSSTIFCSFYCCFIGYRSCSVF